MPKYTNKLDFEIFFPERLPGLVISIWLNVSVIFRTNFSSVSLILKPVSSFTIVNISSIFCSVSLFTLYVQDVDPVPEIRTTFIFKNVENNSR